MMREQPDSSLLAPPAPAAPRATPEPEQLTPQVSQGEGEPPGRVIAVVGACGGMGASTLTLLLARALTDLGRGVAVVDADPAGGLGLLLGDGLGGGLHWADLPTQETAFRPGRLTAALPVWLGATVLTGDWRGGCTVPATVHAAVDALRATCQVVLVDLPRGAQAREGWVVLQVCGLDLRSAAAARILGARLARQSNAPISLVVRPGGEDMSEEDLERVVGARVIATLPDDRSLAQRAARGDDVTRGRGAARRAVRRLAVLVADTWLDAPREPEVIGAGASRPEQ